MNKVSYDNLKGIEQKNGTMPPVNHLSDLVHKICSKYFWKNEKKNIYILVNFIKMAAFFWLIRWFLFIDTIHNTVFLMKKKKANTHEVLDSQFKERVKLI